jgi:DNA mismatch endonuclease (patch repair protein)
MSRIRGGDTTPEHAVRSVLHTLGFRFRVHCPDLPGRPDVVLARHRTVVFVHGCFWHRHRRCRYAYAPKTNRRFWLEKFEDNVTRDRRNAQRLRRLGWRVLVIWECHTHDRARLTEDLRTAFTRTVSKPADEANAGRMT